MEKATAGNYALRIVSAFWFVIGISTQPVFAQKTSWTKDQKAIGFRTINDAYQALKNKKGITTKFQRDLILIRDPDKNHYWQFTRPSHFAHPGVIRTFHYVKRTQPNSIGYVRQKSWPVINGIHMHNHVLQNQKRPPQNQTTLFKMGPET